MFEGYLHQLKATLHVILPQSLSWLDWVLSSLLDFVDISVLDPTGRYYWITGIESMLVLAIAYLLWGGLKAGGGPRGFLRFCFPKGSFTHPSTLVDYQLNLGNFFFAHYVNVVWRFNAAFFTTQFVAALVWAFGPAPHLLQWDAATLVGFTILFAVADDFGYWVWHYLCHKVPFFWAFHSVHHSAEVMTPLVAGRVHPFETALLPVFRTATASVVSAVAIYAFIGQASVVTIFGMSLLAALMGAAGDQLFHAHVPVSWGRRLNHIFISPATHQLHHSIAPEHHDKNMGAYLAVWDWMFGTLVVGRSDQKITFGLTQGAPQIHTNLVVAYARPLWDMVIAARKLFDKVTTAVASLRSPVLPGHDTDAPRPAD